MGPDDRLLDLGSGDGRFCVAACQQFGAAAGTPLFHVQLDGSHTIISRLCSGYSTA